jgi:hypothetical protein
MKKIWILQHEGHEGGSLYAISEDFDMIYVQAIELVANLNKQNEHMREYNVKKGYGMADHFRPYKITEENVYHELDIGDCAYWCYEWSDNSSQVCLKGYPLNQYHDLRQDFAGFYKEDER